MVAGPTGIRVPRRNATSTQFAGTSLKIGKNSLTCITFDKPLLAWDGQFKASQGIWLKNFGVAIEKNCGLDRDCGRFNQPSKIEIPFFKNNDFFDFSVSVWFKRQGGSGCWPVLVSNGNCVERTVQITSKDDTHLIVTVRPSTGLSYEEMFVTKSQSAEWRHVVVTVHVSKVTLNGWTKVYIDGKQVGKGNLEGKMPPVWFPMFIGANACGPCNFHYYNGLMDSVMSQRIRGGGGGGGGGGGISFARYALKAGEVSKLYDSRGLCIGLHGTTETLVPKHWALIVAGSHQYKNYRHHANVCHAYHIMKKNGIPEERIVLMMYDDVAYDPKNPYPGKLFNHPTGPDVYAGVKIDYREKLYADDLNAALVLMHSEKKYKEMVFYLEACHSGSMFQGYLPLDIKVYAVTAAKPEESAYLCYYTGTHGTYLADTFSASWMEDSDAPDAVRHEDMDLAILRHRLAATRDPGEERRIMEEINAVNKTHDDIRSVFALIVKLTIKSNLRTQQILTMRHRIVNFACYKPAVELFSEQCYDLNEYDYALHHIYTLANLCEVGIAKDDILQSIRDVCAAPSI
ncbi:Legumain [Lamellibrachia satsuma]|nr:Legumain [Lamellibrachia satsuma]